MHLNSLAFAGYRSFAARSPMAPDRKLEHVNLAPITVLLGKNNSGKTTVAKMLHHVLLALGSTGNNPLPMLNGDTKYGSIFRDIQHGENFFNPLDISIELEADDGGKLDYEAQLIQLGDLNDDSPPVIDRCIVNKNEIDVGKISFSGLLPDILKFEKWRQQCHQLLDLSCAIPPVRDAVERSYELAPAAAIFGMPESNKIAAQMLAHDVNLRNEVSVWIAENLDGWKIDVKQNLDSFQLQGKRAGRDVNLADAGQGIQQILPIITLCCWRKLYGGSYSFLDIIQQPELHLHDAAHAALGDLLCSATIGGKGKIVVETHSEALVLRLRRRVAEGYLKSSDVSLYYIQDAGDGSRILPITLNELGEVDWWPEGVFSESFVEVKAIRLAQRAREGS